MWARNLLFAAVCLALVAVLVRATNPRADARRASHVQSVDRYDLSLLVRSLDWQLDQLYKNSGVTATPPADDLLVARRISLALHGTIPSLEEIRHFEQLPAESRLETWIAERLGDRRYADYVAERLARAFVGVEDGPFLLFRRRRFVAWLADELAANRPYDQIVRHLVADQGLWTDSPATNFVTVTIVPGDNSRPDPNRLAARSARAFLGIRLDCAECHDHPLARWKQQDFEGLAAFFAGTRQGLRGIYDVPGTFQVENRQTGQQSKVACAVPYAPEALPESGTDRDRLAIWITHTQNRPFAREAVNRAWALLFGRPLIEPIDDIPLEDVGHPERVLLDFLANDFAGNGYDLARLLAQIASSKAFRAESAFLEAGTEGKDPVTGAADSSWHTFPLSRLRPEQVVGALLQSASLSTIDYESGILVRAGRAIGHNEFIERYGDAGADEFDAPGGTIPQRLLMMNGKIVSEKTSDDLIGNAATRIAVLAPDDPTAVETAFLTVLSRRPSELELQHFVTRLNGTSGAKRNGRVGDLVWALLNSSEFSWNH